MDDYAPYKIGVEAAERWMNRPIKVSFATGTPNGSNTQVVYLDGEEAFALIDALQGYLRMKEQD